MPRVTKKKVINWDALVAEAVDFAEGNVDKLVGPNPQYKRLYEFYCAKRGPRYKLVLVYHGTTLEKARSIVSTGFRGPTHPKYTLHCGQGFGPGVYTTTNYKMANDYSVRRNKHRTPCTLLCVGLVPANYKCPTRSGTMFIFRDARFVTPMFMMARR